jgi:hypothetical protein
VPGSKRRLKFLRVQIPRDLWDDLELLTYVLRLEDSQKTKGDIVAEALRKYIEDSPELRKEIERARQVFHIKGEDRDGGDK